MSSKKEMKSQTFMWQISVQSFNSQTVMT